MLTAILRPRLPWAAMYTVPLSTQPGATERVRRVEVAGSKQPVSSVELLQVSAPAADFKDLCLPATQAAHREVL